MKFVLKYLPTHSSPRVSFEVEFLAKVVVSQEGREKVPGS